MPPPGFSKINDFQIFNKTVGEAEIVLQVLIQNAKKGILMIQWEDFVEEIRNFLNFKEQTFLLEKILHNCQDNFHQTVRTFFQKEPVVYVSLKLNSLSFEALQWILKQMKYIQLQRSIKNDCMTPTEKLIFSRIKECFGYKLRHNHWSEIISILLYKCDKNNEIHLKQPLLPMQMTQEIDQVNGQKYFIISFLNDQNWVIQDQYQGIDDQLYWPILIDYLKKIFKIGENMTSTVQNIHSSEQKKSIVKFPKGKNNAIPGGRYGCAQMIKCCGPSELKNLSLGRLSYFVQESISRGLLIYYKTLLIEGTLDGIEDLKAQKGFEKEKEKKVDWVKRIIVDILKKNVGGVQLAKLPGMINRHVNFHFDVQDLGFLKLKSLLKIIDGIYIENDGTTFAVAHFNQKHYNISANLGQIKQKICELLKNPENTPGCNGDNLYQQLVVCLGYNLNLQDFGALNFCDFLQKYADDICKVRIGIEPYDFTVFGQQQQEDQFPFKAEFSELEFPQTSDSDSFQFIENLLDDDLKKKKYRNDETIEPMVQVLDGEIYEDLSL